jgi:outer membrane protein OmpA-like peptidoglycan-associated protein
LKALAEVMTEYPELELKVTSHTDSRGHATYNNWLSTRRANRTVDYLVGLGVVSNRLMAEAYGEDNLLNDCDDDTYCLEEKHQINRRSEFVIVRY